MERPIDRLLALMAHLRDPEAGCPWDIQQTFATIAPYTIEEAYEVADAIHHDDMASLKDELGDLLLQVVFHARMAEEAGLFGFEDVAQAIADKLKRRHPHVFGDGVPGGAEVAESWEAQKAAERQAKAAARGLPPSVLDDVSLALPALSRAEKLTKRAARVGFDWPDIEQVFDKLHEELDELRAEMAVEAPPDRVTDELGDLLFVIANLGRHLKTDPEAALRHANEKFTRRFREIEAALAAQGRSPEHATLAEMEALWQQAKACETR